MPLINFTKAECVELAMHLNSRARRIRNGKTLLTKVAKRFDRAVFKPKKRLAKPRKKVCKPRRATTRRSR